MPLKNPAEFRPRLPYSPALVRLAGINRRTPTLEAQLAIELHLERNRRLLENGPKLKK